MTNLLASSNELKISSIAEYLFEFLSQLALPLFGLPLGSDFLEKLVFVIRLKLILKGLDFLSFLINLTILRFGF